MKPYAVVFTYSFDSDCAVYTFDTFMEAKQFLSDSFHEEVRIQTEENGRCVEAEMSEDGAYAEIKTFYGDEGSEPDIIYCHIGGVYR